MAQLEQTPLSKFLADAFARFFLLAAICSLRAFFILVFPVFANPEASAIYQQVSTYLAAQEPMVAAGDAKAGFKIGSDGRLVITFLIAVVALSAFGSFLGALVSGAIHLFYYSNDLEQVVPEQDNLELIKSEKTILRPFGRPHSELHGVRAILETGVRKRLEEKLPDPESPPPLGT